MATSVDWDVVETVDDLDKVFKKAISRAEEADEPAVRLEWAEAKSEFYQRRSEKAELNVARQAALDKYPLARDFAEDVRGATPQEIEASAKRFHERVEKLQGEKTAAQQKAVDDDAAQRALAQQQYGTPAAAGTGTPIPPLLEPHEALERRIHQRLADGKGLQDSQSRMDVARWVPDRLRAGIIQSQSNPSYKSTRPGTADDKKIADDRTARKNAR